MKRFSQLLVLSVLASLLGCDGKINDVPQENLNASDGGVSSSDAGFTTVDGGDGVADSGTPPVIDPDRHIACVQRINNFRATEGLPPLTRWTDAETCSNEQSGLDANGGGAHGNFGSCGENAQNTCPNWPNIDAVLEGCLQVMWDEGPGEPFSEHGHYLNMSNPNFTKVACGFYEGPNGIWANQNFK